MTQQARLLALFRTWKVSVVKAIVQQIGARMDYAVARALHADGLLEALVTDIHFSSQPRLKFLQSYFANLPPENVSKDNLKGILYRVALSRLHNTFWPNLMAAETIAKRTCDRAEKTGADLVYGFDTAMLPSMDRLKRSGLCIAMEQCVAPRAQFLSAQRILSAKLQDIGIDFDESGLGDTLAYFSVMAALEREEWQRADLIYCPSPFVQKALQDQGVPEDRIRVVPYGVTLSDDLASSRPASSGTTRVVFGGAFSWRKGALEFGRLATALKDRARFEAFGKNALPEPIAAKIAPDVLRHGHMPKAAFHEAIQTADIFVLPSYMEGSATVIYEAMAMGLPCVVSEECGSVITDRQDGMIVKAGDETALRQAVETLLDNPNLRREIGERATETAKLYTRESYGARVVSMLQADFDDLKSKPAIAATSGAAL